jgi:arylsulfatase A-like enzyme
MRSGFVANFCIAVFIILLLAGLTTDLRAQSQKPNIVVIWGDDIGFWNLSVYSHGAMGYRTPNIDRIGKEGAVFSDHYAQPSCTAGRAAFITGQLPIRSGMVTVGTPGSTLGLKPETVTLGEVLKTQGYATGQFGKNHLGDRNENMPTVHGFDEFFGNLYHLNVSEEPEEDGYPTDPAFREKYGPRGVLHCWATSTETPGEDPRFGKWGKQRCEDTGQLTRKRMEHVDDEFTAEGFKFMNKAAAEKKPFFIWFATSRMHVLTHPPAEYLERCKQYTTGEDPHCAGMLQHDENVGQILKKIDDMGIANNTIVIYSTDNGPEHSSWPYGATTPYRSEKMTTWEGAVRVPMMVRWPGKIAPGTDLNGIQSSEDVFTTLAAAAGAPDVRERLAKGDDFGTGVIKKNYIDGFNQLDYWTGKTDKSARNFIIYYAESHLKGVRVNQWKVLFGSTRDGYYGASQDIELAWLFNIRQDPFESYDQAPGPRATLMQTHTYLEYMVQDILTEHIKSLREFPPAQKGATLNFDEMMQAIPRVPH